MALGGSILTWFEGRWHAGNLPILGAADHGTWQGTLVFDGARAFEGVTPDLDLHCARARPLGRGDGPRAAARRRARSRRWSATASAGSARDRPLYLRPMMWSREGSPALIDAHPRVDRARRSASRSCRCARPGRWR